MTTEQSHLLEKSTTEYRRTTIKPELTETDVIKQAGDTIATAIREVGASAIGVIAGIVTALASDVPGSTTNKYLQNVGNIMEELIHPLQKTDVGYKCTCKNDEFFDKMTMEHPEYTKWKAGRQVDK